MATFRGNKGGDYTNAPETIRSEDSLEVILGVGEGENFGLAEGAKSLLVSKTPLVNANGESNFKNFELREYTGTEAGHLITPQLGGFGSPQSVGVTLVKDTSVTRQGTLTDYDFIDVRLLIQALSFNKKEGSYANEALVRFEQKASTDADWSYAIPGEPVVGTTTTPGPGVNITTGYSLDEVVSYNNDRPLIYSDVEPAPPEAERTVWLDASGAPREYFGGIWVDLPDTTDEGDYFASGDVRYYKPSAAPPGDAGDIPVGSVWTPTSTYEAPRQYNGSSWLKAALAQAAANAATSISSLPNGVIRIFEKISSATVKEVRIAIPRRAVPTDIRVTLLSPETDSSGKKVCSINWESFEEIAAVTKIFPNTHILHLIGRASDQLSGFPDLEGDIKGRIVKVPSNYDPVTRTYSGIWDYTYKKAWTDNGAFCTQDFVESTRYGLSALYPQTVNKGAFYEWAQWCDVPVPDGQGGTRPRWTYNDDISQPRPAKEQAQYMAGACGARLIDDGAGNVDVLVDRDEEMCMVFGPENVVDGEFNYSFTGIQTRANWIKVGFVNPNLGWAVDYRVVKDDDHIAEYGRMPMSMVAAGKTNASEALAAARLRLITAITEKTIVVFRTNRLGKYLRPFSVIGICDPDMGWGVSGRIRAKTGDRTVTLRDPVTLESGVSYTATFTYPVATSVEGEAELGTIELPITTLAGTVTTLTFSADLPANLPEFAQFSLSAPAQIGVPKPFKVISITKADGDGEAVEIMCLELNRNKWAFVDGAEEDLLDVPETTSYTGEVLKPTGIKTAVNVRTVGGIPERALQIRWDALSNPFTRNVEVEYSRDGNRYSLVGTANNNFYEVPNVDTGTHWIQLTRIHTDGVKRSRSVQVIHQVESDIRSIGPVENLALVDEPLPALFESEAPKFRWEHGLPDVNFSHYELRILDPITSVIRRTEILDIPEFIYDLEKQKLDCGGTPARTLTVSVTKIDDFDGRSAPVELEVENATPAAPVLTVTQTIGGVNVVLTPPIERDVKGALLWVSDDEAFVPALTAVAQEGDQQSFFVPIPRGARYIRAAYYDGYSKLPGGLLISAQVVGAATLVTEENILEGVAAAEAFIEAMVAQHERNVDINFRTYLPDGRPATQVINHNLTNLGLTVDGLGVTVVGNATAIGTLGQVYGSVGFTVNADGNIAGMRAFAGGGAVNTSGVILEGDSIVFRNGASVGIQPFVFDTLSGKFYTQSLVAGEVDVNVLNGDEMKVSGQLKVGAGDDTIILNGAHVDKRFWIGDAVAEKAPFSVSKTGKLKATDWDLFGANGQLMLSSAGLTDAFRLATITSYQNAAPASATSFGTVVHRPNTTAVPAESIALARLGDDSTVSVKVDWNLSAAVGALVSDFTNTTLTVYQRYSVDGTSFGAWSSIGSQAFTKITSGSPTSTQFRVVAAEQSYREYDSGFGGVVLVDQDYAYIDTPGALSFTIAAAAKSAGYYQYCVVGGNAAPFLGCVSQITLTDTDGVPSFFASPSSVTTGSVPFANPTGAYKRLRITRPTSTTVAVTAAWVVVATPEGLNRTIANLSTTIDVTGGVGLNKLDTGSLPGGAAWLYIWAVSNGVTDGTVVSTSDTSPSLAGYRYTALIGVLRWVGSYVYPFNQRGNVFTYAATNGSTLDMASGDVGDHDAAGDAATWVAVDVVDFVPVNVTVDIIVQMQANAGTGIVAPNNSYGGFDSTTNRPPFVNQTGSGVFSQEVRMTLEGTNLFWATSAASWKMIAKGFVLDI